MLHYDEQSLIILFYCTFLISGVIPDPETGEILINIFGERGYPVRKFMGMLYWMPKFKNILPWPLPQEVPKEPFDLAMLAIKRITGVDRASKISVHSVGTLLLQIQLVCVLYCVPFIKFHYFSSVLLVF